MNSAETLALLEKHGAFIRNTHVVLAGGAKRGDGPHGDAYVNFKKLYPCTFAVSDISDWLARLFHNVHIEAAVGPPMGGVLLAHEAATSLTLFNGPQVWAPIAEKTDGPERFVFRPEYAELLCGRNVAIFEDVVKTADSIIDLGNVVEKHGGAIVAVGAVFDRRGGKGRDHRFLANYKYLVGMELNEWPAAECLLCVQGVPVNTNVGYGKAFLDSQTQQS